MTIEELRALLTQRQEEIRGLADADSITAEQEARLTEALGEFEWHSAELAQLEERQRRIDSVRNAETGREPGVGPQVLRKGERPAPAEVRSMQRAEARDAALAVLESEGGHLAARQRDNVDRLMRSGSTGEFISKLTLITESPAYRSGFQKAINGHQELLNDEERQALNAYFELRAVNEGTGSAGGYGIPVLIDPTIILTSQAADAPILEACRIITITTDAWKGVTSDGMSWGYTSESGVVADGTPTLAQPVINVNRASGFIPYTIEVEQDYPGFAEEMAMLLDAGYIDLVANTSINGSGTPPTPLGIVTALMNSTSPVVQVAVGTHGSLAASDITSVFAAVPERFRPRASWLMNVNITELVRLFSTGGPGGTFTVDLTQADIPMLLGKKILQSDYAPTLPTGTNAGAIAVVGDFNHFIVVQRAGMTVEPVQHLLDTSTGRPTGQRAWFAWTRHGMGVDSVKPFRVLVNKTS